MRFRQLVSGFTLTLFVLIVSGLASCAANNTVAPPATNAPTIVPTNPPFATATIEPTAVPTLTATSQPSSTPTITPTATPHVVATAQPLTLVWQSDFTDDAKLVAPSDIALNASGEIYVTTQGAKLIKKFDANGKLIGQWGDPGSGDGQFNLTSGLAIDTKGNVYVADFYNTRIQKFDANGKYLMQWRTEPPAGPASIIVNAQGFAYVDNFFYHQHHVQKFDANGKPVNQWGGDGTGDGQFGASATAGPEDIALDAAGNVYVVDRLNSRIQKFDPNGKLLAIIGGLGEDGQGKFYQPTGLAIDAQGNLFVFDTYFLQKLDPNGNFIEQWGVRKGVLRDGGPIVALDAEGYLYSFAKVDPGVVKGAGFNDFVLKKMKVP